jgi:hypothetical protein
MRTVGQKIEKPLSLNASGGLMREAAAFKEMLQNAFPSGKLGYVPKGIYRFASHEAANKQDEIFLAQHMAKIECQMNLRHSNEV